MRMYYCALMLLAVNACSQPPSYERVPSSGNAMAPPIHLLDALRSDALEVREEAHRELVALGHRTLTWLGSILDSSKYQDVHSPIRAIIKEIYRSDALFCFIPPPRTTSYEGSNVLLSEALERIFGEFIYPPRLARNILARWKLSGQEPVVSLALRQATFWEAMSAVMDVGVVYVDFDSKDVITLTTERRTYAFSQAQGSYLVGVCGGHDKVLRVKLFLEPGNIPCGIRFQDVSLWVSGRMTRALAKDVQVTSPFTREVEARLQSDEGGAGYQGEIRGKIAIGRPESVSAVSLIRVVGKVSQAQIAGGTVNVSKYDVGNGRFDVALKWRGPTEGSEDDNVLGTHMYVFVVDDEGRNQLISVLPFSGSTESNVAGEWLHESQPTKLVIARPMNLRWDSVVFTVKLPTRANEDK